MEAVLETISYHACRGRNVPNIRALDGRGHYEERWRIAGATVARRRQYAADAVTS